MSGDKLKNKAINILKDYVDEFKKYLKKFKKKLKKISKKIIKNYKKIKEYLLCEKNRKRNLTTIGILIIVNFISLISIMTLSSYAIYKNNTEFSVLGARIGDKYSNKFDYTLLVYIEEVNDSGAGSGTYNLTSDIPTIGYTYSGYKCKNNSTLTYDDSTLMTSVITNQRDVCSMYFDLTNNTDISIKIMLEDSIDSNTYTVNDNIPFYGYKYSHYECKNNSELIYNSELHTATVSTTSKEYCNIYFEKENTDIEMNLYVEETYGSRDYIERLSIPNNHEYVLNETNTVCTNLNMERVDGILTYVDGYVEVNTQEMVSCNVYLDRKNA